MNQVLDYLDELFPDPKCELNYNKDYELLIAVVLSAQTTDKKVNMVTEELFSKCSSLKELSKINISKLKEILKPIGTYNKKADFVKKIANQLIEKYAEKVPNNHKDLESLPGVGHKTANVVLGNIYNIPTFAVDTHVSRVSKRLGFVDLSDDVVLVEEKMKKILPKDRWCRTHHQLVLFGRYYCKARNPLCSTCKLKNICRKKK